MKQLHIIGGGTFSYVRNHLAKHRPEEVIYTTLEETISRALEKLILLQ